MDGDAWHVREKRFSKKFKAGRKYIHGLFERLGVEEKPDQIALLVYGSTRNRTKVGSGTILTGAEFMQVVRHHLRDKPIQKAAVSEQFPILKGLQLAAQHWRD